MVLKLTHLPIFSIFFRENHKEKAKKSLSVGLNNLTNYLNISYEYDTVKALKTLNKNNSIKILKDSLHGELSGSFSKFASTLFSKSRKDSLPRQTILNPNLYLALESVQDKPKDLTESISEIAEIILKKESCSSEIEYIKEKRNKIAIEKYMNNSLQVMDEEIIQLDQYLVTLEKQQIISYIKERFLNVQKNSNNERFSFDSLLHSFSPTQFTENLKNSFNDLESFIKNQESDKTLVEIAKKQQLVLLELGKVWVDDEKNQSGMNLVIDDLLSLAESAKNADSTEVKEIGLQLDKSIISASVKAINNYVPTNSIVAKKIFYVEQTEKEDKLIREVFLKLKKKADISSKEEISFETLLSTYPFLMSSKNFFNHVVASLNSLENFISAEKDEALIKIAVDQQLILLDLCKGWVKQEKNHKELKDIQVHIVEVANTGKKSLFQNVRKEASVLQDTITEELKKPLQSEESKSVDNTSIDKIFMDLQKFFEKPKTDIDEFIKKFNLIFMDAYKYLEMSDIRSHDKDPMPLNWKKAVDTENYIIEQISISLKTLDKENLVEAIKIYENLLIKCLEVRNLAMAKIIYSGVSSYLVTSRKKLTEEKQNLKKQKDLKEDKQKFNKEELEKINKKQEELNKEQKKINEFQKFEDEFNDKYFDFFRIRETTRGDCAFLRLQISLRDEVPFIAPFEHFSKTYNVLKEGNSAIQDGKINTSYLNKLENLEFQLSKMKK